jgi:hypothetical protein
MADLYRSASGAYPGGPSGDFRAGWAGLLEIDGRTALHLTLEKDELISLVRTMADHPAADEVFLSGAREYQAQLIRENATAPAVPGKTDLVWVNQIGSFDGIVMNAHGLDLAEEFDKDNKQHQIVFKFLDTTIGLVGREFPVYSAGASLLVDGIEDATRPSFQALVEDTDDEKELITATTHAMIAAGYYEAGLLGPEGAPPPELLVNGHLVPFTELKDPNKIRQYLIWVETNKELNRIAGEAFDRADQARDNRVYPAVPTR